MALKNTDSLQNISKLMSFSVGLNFEDGVTIFLSFFADLVFYLEGRPMAVISTPVGWLLFTIFGGIVIVDTTYILLASH